MKSAEAAGAEAGSVAVVIAAYNAEATIGRAIASALAEPEVGEVLVADDASTDATLGAAQAADDGTGRLRVLRAARNAGPAAARNRAIAESRLPYIAILDSDDLFLPGRFARLFAETGWDLIADNIVFAAEPEALGRAGPPAAGVLTITAERFIAGNIPRRSAARRELGFLKPVIRRDFLERTGLGYREELRLGEDFDLYLRMLLAGARFSVLLTPGYGALERPESLSGRHGTADLSRLLEAEREILAGPMPPPIRAALDRHARSVRARYRHRAFLDDCRARGRGAGLIRVLGAPGQIPALFAAILADKLGGVWFFGIEQAKGEQAGLLLDPQNPDGSGG